MSRVALISMLLLTTGIAPRVPKPHPSAHRMANEARLIVEGRLGDGGVVEIKQQHFAADGVATKERIVVPALVDMSRVPGSTQGQPAKAIAPDSVLLFLGDNRGDEWQPLYALDGGARGVLWLVGDEAWGYSQLQNPGPYELDRWRVAADGKMQLASTRDVRAQVASGLAARKAWQLTLAIVDAKKQAQAMARWFGPTTSPDGALWQERFWPELVPAAKNLGEAIVAPLGRVVATEVDAEAVGAAASLLGEFGVQARLAVPSLIARLRDPRGVRTILLLEALTRIPDARAIDALRSCLDSNESFVVAEAARALHAAGDREAATRLLAHIPMHADDAPSMRDLAQLLDALHDIDAAAAESLVRARFLDQPQLLGESQWLRQLGRL